MTLREQILKQSGLLTEEILEEGRFKRALAIASIIAAAAGAAIFGPKAVGEIKQYNRVRNTPVAARYENAADEVNEKIANRKSFIQALNFHEKLDYVKSIKSEYVAKENQAIIHVYVNNHNQHYISSEVEKEVIIALKEYKFLLQDYYSAIEDKISYSVNEIPLKVIIHFDEYLLYKNNAQFIKKVSDVIWTDNVEIEAPKREIE